MPVTADIFGIAPETNCGNLGWCKLRIEGTKRVNFIFLFLFKTKKGLGMNAPSELKEGMK